MIDLAKIQYRVVVMDESKNQYNIKEYIENLGWEENDGELSVRTSFVAKNDKTSKGYLSKIIKPGCLVGVFATDGASQDEEVARGYVETWNPVEKSGGHTLKCTCYDELYKLQKSQDNRYFPSGTGTKSAIEGIFDDWEIPQGSYQGPNYIQLQAVKLDDDTYMVQEFDNELVFMGELWSGCKYPDEVLDWMKSNYEIESCLTAEVYRSSLGDCTNNGISSYARELYILDAQKGPFEPDDIRQCVYIEKREIMGQEYVDCKPAYCRKRWYMAGGNILYTSDSRFKQITGISYPIAIHDRYEGR